MILDKVTTPNFLVDLDVLERNIQKIAKLCEETGNNLCPMVKTHKCSEIALLQKAAGATSFVVGTIDEAEVLADKGIDKIVFPYPIIGESNISSQNSARKARFIKTKLLIKNHYIKTYNFRPDSE